MDLEEKAILCVLHSIKGLGHRSLCRIIDEFKSYKACFTADTGRLRKSFISADMVDEIISIRGKMDPVLYLQKMNDKGIAVAAIEEEDYPQELRNIANPPVILYYRGNAAALRGVCMAVIGSRAATVYGKNTARKLGQSLAQYGILVVSGMARGIDREAHYGALDGNGGTIAVLGSGIDVVYPRENIKLYEEITARGLVISEFPLGANPEPGHFPRRNRIISGLSRGVVVVEARVKSGALITADFALEQGKDVFAVPGPINSPASAGTNNLIKQGAILLTGVEDIIAEYNDLQTGQDEKSLKQKELLLLDSEELVIMENMDYEPCHFDQLLSASGFDIGRLSSLLLNLELRGMVKSIPGNYYVKIC